MEIITVHEHKFLLIVGVIDAAFFGACWFFSVLSGIRHNDLSMILICTLIFGGFMRKWLISSGRYLNQR